MSTTPNLTQRRLFKALSEPTTIDDVILRDIYITMRRMIDENVSDGKVDALTEVALNSLATAGIMYSKHTVWKGIQRSAFLDLMETTLSSVGMEVPCH